MDGPKTMGVILAGQHVWRDSRFDRLSPRPLLPVANRPLFSYPLQWLHASGIRDIAVATNAETRLLHTVLPDLTDIPGVSIHSEITPRGPAGSVRDAVIGSDAETIVVADGTSIPTTNLTALLAHHHAAGAAATIVVRPEAASGPGSTRFGGGGVYVFDRRTIEHVSVQGYEDIKEGLLPRLYDAGEKTTVYGSDELSPRVVDGSSYLALNDWAVERVVSGVANDDYVAWGSGRCHATAQIADDAVVIGPVLVGPHTQVLGGATIIGPSSIGPDCVIGAGALVFRSAVWRGSDIGECAVANRCVVAGAAIAAREWALGQVLLPPQAGRAEASASDQRTRPSILGFRPDILVSE